MHHLIKRSAHTSASLFTKKPDDVVVTWVKRTALTKARKGGFKDTSPDLLLFKMLESARSQSGVPSEKVEDLILGNCHHPSPCYLARATAISAGFAQHTPVAALNRLCGSGLMAIRAISDSVNRGDIDIGLAVGMESMTFNPRPSPAFEAPQVLANESAKDCAEPMGWTSEMVGKDFTISRQKMDEYACRSHNLAEKATKSGLFSQEIIPVNTITKDESGAERQIIVEKDDGIRNGTTIEALAKAKPAFPQWGTLSTGGNSSQMTDGAAAAFLMKRKTADQLGLKPIARHINTSVVGVTPRHMGIGPAEAIPKVLAAAGLSADDVNLFEINEAFATMYVYCVEKLGLDLEKVNVNGGAIALGHPLGATGIRQVATGLAELVRREEKILCTSMCIGSGMGAASLWINEAAMQ